MTALSTTDLLRRPCLDGPALLQVAPKGLHPLERGRLLHRLRPVGDLLPGLDLLTWTPARPGPPARLAERPARGACPAALGSRHRSAFGSNPTGSQVRQEVKSDRKSSPTGSQVHRRTSITLIPGASARSSIFGFSGRSSPTHSPAYCSPANFSPACFSPAHLGHGPALRGARSTSASRHGSETRAENGNREREPGPCLRKVPWS